ncbi:MAG: hypothetical protein HNEKOMLI_00854 [Sodalis sp. Psp]|nr:hypothetical protein [Sodalis sp. Psp]MCR3757173.1 hypothetical protein [Sodalis sp. Ppy]
MLDALITQTPGIFLVDILISRNVVCDHYDLLGNHLSLWGSVVPKSFDIDEAVALVERMIIHYLEQ